MRFSEPLPDFDLSPDYVRRASDPALQACELNWISRATTSEKEALRLLREGQVYRARAIAAAWIREHREDLISPSST